MENERLPISDDACEKLVLGTLLSNRNAIGEIGNFLSEDCFYSSLHKAVYRAIKKITDRGDSADIILLKAELDKTPYKMEPYDIVELSMNNTFDLTQHALRLKDLSIRRKFFEMGCHLIQAGTTENDEIEEVVRSVRKNTDQIYTETGNPIKTAYDYATESYKRINDNLVRKEIQGTPTGFTAIDERGGLQPTNLILIAAESSQGKTSLAGCMTLHAAKSGAKIAFYSLEMTGEQMMNRFASVESGIPSARIQNEGLKADELSKVSMALSKLSELPIFFDDRSTSNIDTIITSIRSLKLKENIDGAVIDYLQILSVSRCYGNVELELGETARRLKNLAKELGIWIIALSQLNRDGQNPEPTVNRLRGSGQLNEAADITILIYRPEMYHRKYSTPYQTFNTHGTALINVAKGRNIGIFKFIAGFDEPTTKFYELTESSFNTSILTERTNEQPF